jgi:uncharacterized delta-60 repeat protein
MLIAALFSSTVVHGDDGHLDPNFGTNGRVLTSFPPYGARAVAALVQPDDHIVVVGTADYQDFAVARFQPDGTLDPGFGTGGTVVTDFGYATVWAVARQPDGKLVVGGASNPYPVNFTLDDFALVRYEADGTLDPTFGVGGKVLTDLGGSERIHALLVQPDGRILAVGEIGYGTTVAIARYTPDGTLDPTFGVGGVATFVVGYAASADAALLLPGGRILVAGFSQSTDSSLTQDFMLARLEPDGSLDATFGSGGAALTDFGDSSGDSSDRAYGLALHADGRIVTVGQHG